MLFWSLLASGQISMRKVDGWRTLASKPAEQSVELGRLMILRQLKRVPRDATGSKNSPATFVEARVLDKEAV
jgi:hypothetical protein